MTIQPAFIPPGYLSLAPISDPAVVVLNFKNESPHFMSVKMLDYAQWLQSGNEKESMVFELNVREKDVKKTTEVFNSTDSNLFLFTAYFRDFRITYAMDTIIKPVDTSITLNLTIGFENGGTTLKRDDSFEILTLEEANNILSYF
ncbi:MAG: hypothetical protein WA347_04375 [Rhabdochlamydiaceae bacterium]|jgi:hypothetical protein